MPIKCHPYSPNLVRHLFVKDASCPGTGQAAILDLQDLLRGPRYTISLPVLPQGLKLYCFLNKTHLRTLISEIITYLI